MEVEIASYLTKISEESISNKASEQINSLLFIISHIENMGDACHNLLRSTERRIDQKFQLTADMEKNLKQVADLCKIQISEIIMNLNLEKNEIEHQKIVDTQGKAAPPVAENILECYDYIIGHAYPSFSCPTWL